jgi:hypothetical protein
MENIDNKKIVLYEPTGTADDPLTTSILFGVNGTLRYQVDATGS